ncbi:nicotinamide riboside transporter PnuC [Undibacterium sp. SXout7W]|uniref:nicotinamide riboside transporter PnuC n=1 Tax=Undibacterium sp. SXout7W TaxID=3413049 RepID=UPI003BF3B2C5
MNESISVFGFSTSLLELSSFILSVITVFLNIRQRHWAWLFSILASGLYAAVFFDARLYGDMALQFVFIGVSIWGWWLWLSGIKESSASSPRWLTMVERWVVVVVWMVVFVPLAWFLKSYTDTDVPYVDGFLTAGSLVGQVLLSRKKIENWHVWIIVDVIYVGLYMYKNLMLTAILYAIFVVMAVTGLKTWSKACQQ